MRLKNTGGKKREAEQLSGVDWSGKEGVLRVGEINSYPSQGTKQIQIIF